MSSTDDLCKQFGPRSGPTFCWARYGSNLFDTLMIFLKEFFDNKGNDDEQHPIEAEGVKFYDADEAYKIIYHRPNTG